MTLRTISFTLIKQFVPLVKISPMNRLLVFTVIFATSCSTQPELPTVSTDAISNITHNSSTVTYSVTDEGTGIVEDRGIAWNTSPNPNLANEFSSGGGGIGSFTDTLTGLTSNTTYYVRAYAVNEAGTAFGNQQTFTTGNVVVSTPGNGVTDVDGNYYSSVELGNGQEWLAENLRTTSYANGDPIPNVTWTGDWTNLSDGAWCYYDNDSQFDNSFGKLYNWYAVTDNRNVCPTGWHVPSDDEWNTLITYLDPEANPTGYSSQSLIAGGKMKSTGTQHWSSTQSDVTNESGFSGLPGGWRHNSGTFDYMNSNGYWWSSSTYASDRGWCRRLFANSLETYRIYNYGRTGLSVRCIKD